MSSTRFTSSMMPSVAPADEPTQGTEDDYAAAAARKEAAATVDGDSSDAQGGSDSDEPFHKDAQAGVQNIEVTTTVWTKSALIFAYVWIWVIYFVDSMQQGTTTNLTPWVTSAFQEHSLTPTVQIMSSIIGGVSKLTIAKILDVVGRPTGYIICVFLTTLGLILMACCNGVELYAAAQVFYWVGYNGLGFCLDIFIADTSSLRNRGLMFAYISSPYIITTWLSGPISQAFLNGPGWRWGFGVFTIITPIVTMPIWVLFTHYLRVAKKQGLIPPRNSGRTFFQSFVHYAREFDAVGLFLITAGISIFLLAFNLAPNQPGTWDSPLVICFLVFGILLIIGFAVWEKWFAPVTFIPFELLTDRTVVGAYILSATLFVSFYIWNSYFTSFLQAVNGLNVTEASYVSQIYSLGSCFFSIPVGFAIRYTGRFKWIALYFGMPVTMLGAGLMIKFRQPDVNIGYIIMCQIFIAFAGGALVICEQVAAMAAAAHQHVAVVLAVEGMFSSIGGAIGLTVSSAIWQEVFPRALEKYLPESEQANLLTIYGDLATQLSYPWGSPTRIAIQNAYGDAVRYMLIASTSILIIGFVSVAVWRDIKVKDRKQVKGVVI